MLDASRLLQVHCYIRQLWGRQETSRHEVHTCLQPQLATVALCCAGLGCRKPLWNDVLFGLDL